MLRSALLAILAVAASAEPSKQQECLLLADVDTLSDNEYARREGGPLENAAELNCDFEQPCCWRALESTPLVKVRNPETITTCLGELVPRRGPGILLIASEKEKNYYSSCSLLCAKGPIRVTVDHSRSKDVKLRACLRDSFLDGAPMKECRSLLNGRADLPGGPLVDVVIEASGLKTEDDFVLFRSIKIDAEPCDIDLVPANAVKRAPEKSPEETAEKPVKPVAPNATLDICKHQCAFDKDLCGWENAPGQRFRIREYNDIVGNLDTGVNAELYFRDLKYPLTSGGPYAGVYLGPYETARMTIHSSGLKRETRMVAKYYDACQKFRIEACADDHCEPMTETGVRAADRKWVEKKFILPWGTKEINIIANNVGHMYCSGGVMDIRFQDYQGNPYC